VEYSLVALKLFEYRLNIFEDFSTLWKVVKNINGYVTSLYGAKKFQKIFRKLRGCLLPWLPNHKAQGFIFKCPAKKKLTFSRGTWRKMHLHIFQKLYVLPSSS